MNTLSQMSTTRRGLLGGSLGIGALGLLAGCSPSPQTGGGGGSGNPFTMVTWGGTSEEAFLEAWGTPFIEATGRTITTDTIDYGRFATQAESGKLEWDWFDCEAYYALGNPDFFQPLDYDRLEVDKDDFIEMPNDRGQAFTERALVSYWTSWVSSYRTDRDGPRPMNWEQFFDTKAIPGKRSVYNWPQGMLEIALLADGVAYEDLYPLDLERAFAKYDSIRDDLVFWNSAAESQQYLVSGAADFVVTWNNRIGNLALGGEAVAIEWEGNLRSYGMHVVPENARDEEGTYEWIKLALKPENQAALSLGGGMAPTLKSASASIPADVRKWLSTEPEAIEKSVGGADEKWWGENLAEVSTRWYEWAGQ
ncbi:extracellular solute-binding protein [Leucobacter soli]|uniref:Spermidine/putrescine transport system substrate-binding protein n=1 Tax=Leucobacter soli TaxID=2812850 RepID=A0A916JXZ6_9MICO|nr:extracellular solute-binding protein [Leucobacter soli]CAG7605178.1 hypothetical protein LEUCIP111803_00804 [Leucobacter soli]